MANEEKKELSLGREITKEISKDACGIGAGLIAGTVALAAVEAIPGIGRGMKLLLKMGAYGIEIATMFKVRDAVDEYVQNIYDAVDAVKELVSGPKNAGSDVKVEVEGAVE